MEELDIRKFRSLNLIDKKPTRPKSLKTKRSSKAIDLKPSNDIFSPKSRQLDFLETLIAERQSLCRTSSLPNLSNDRTEKMASPTRRSSFPENSHLLTRATVRSSECVQSSSREERRFIKTHQRSRSDTASNILYFQPVSRTEEAGAADEADGEAVRGCWSRIVPASTGWYPRPRANQSLLQFLAETERGGRAQLERENAHFILSEAIISTFEQMNFERCLHQIEEDQGMVGDLLS